MAIDFGILGELRVVLDGQERDLGSLRQRALLARLILHADQPLSSDRLLDELWPEGAPETARHALHVYVSRLRTALGAERERLTNDTSGYRLHVAADELDAGRFERLAADGRSTLNEDPAAAAETLREALTLWRGPALVEFAHEPFAETEATRLDQLRLNVLEDRVWADLHSDHHEGLVDELRTLTLEQPFREVFWEQYMLALYRAGRQADALHVFGEARMRLAEDLGVEPGPALRRMEQRILDHDPALSGTAASSHLDAPTPPGPIDNLPLQRTTFVGRERDLAIAGELLEASRLLTLTGAPGSGKTRMALRLATEHRDRFPDGLFFVALAGVADARGLDQAALAALVQAGLELDPIAEDSPTDELALRLRDRRCLLILDNFEQLTPAADRVGRLLDEAPSLTIMATSRSPLGLAGEQEFPVLPLAVPPIEATLGPAELRSYDAVALLVARARTADPEFDVREENAAVVAGITARLDGLPLAIELGAGRLRLFTPQSLLDRLEHRLPLLTGGPSDVIHRHQTLRDAIAWSYELLDEADQRLFRRLAAFAGGFTAEAAAAVAGLSPEEAWSGIDSLLAKSLLHRPVDTGEARFAMLQTLREFALERLDDAGELAQALSDHARYYRRLAEALEPALNGAEREAAVAQLTPETENMRTAIERCLKGDDREVGLRLAAATWRYWQAAGRLSEAREWLDALLEDPGLGQVTRADGLTAAAGAAYWLADYDVARAHYEAALDLYRALSDRAREADTLNSLSMTATWQGDPVGGSRLAAEARAVFEELGARDKVGEASMAQGFALLQQREYAAARPHWEKALAISRELGADALAVTQIPALAVIDYHAGALDDATRTAIDALELACRVENVPHCVWMLDFVAAFAAHVEPATAVRVAGAADALRQAAGGGMRTEDLYIEPARTAASSLLSPADLEAAWTEGGSLTLEEAIALARSLRPGEPTLSRR